ncbi:MAG: hypothetical protein QXS41_03785 [Candidatus Woesearchaeota archaeon]
MKNSKIIFLFILALSMINSIFALNLNISPIAKDNVVVKTEAEEFNITVLVDSLANVSINITNSSDDVVYSYKIEGVGEINFSVNFSDKDDDFYTVLVFANNSVDIVFNFSGFYLFTKNMSELYNLLNDSETTQLNEIDDWNSVQNVKFTTSIGKIEFNEPINFTDNKTIQALLNLSQYFLMLAQQKNVIIGLDSAETALFALNKTANVTVFNYSQYNIKIPKILRDGLECSDCQILNMNEDLTFQVPHWSNYTVTQTPANVTDVTLNQTSINLENRLLEINITMSQEMNTSVNLTVVLSLSGSWVSGDWVNKTLWQGVYNFSENLNANTVQINISDGVDETGTVMLPNITIKNLNVDTKKPIATITFNRTLINLDNKELKVTVSFDENMNTAVTPTVSLSGVDSSNYISQSQWKNNGEVYEVTYTFKEGVELIENLTFTISGGKDLAGNGMASAQKTEEVTIDTKKPTATITIDAPNVINLTNRTLIINVSFDENMSTNENLTVDVNVSGNWLSRNWVNATLWQGLYEVAQGVESVGVKFTISGGKDLAGNGMDSTEQTKEVMIDTIAPQIISISVNPAQVTTMQQVQAGVNITLTFNSSRLDDGTINCSLQKDGIINVNSGWNKQASIVLNSGNIGSLGNGNVSVTCIVVDNAGNEHTLSTSFIKNVSTPVIKYAYFVDNDKDGVVGDNDEIVVVFDQEVSNNQETNASLIFSIEGVNLENSTISVQGTKVTITLQDVTNFVEDIKNSNKIISVKQGQKNLTKKDTVDPATGSAVIAFGKVDISNGVIFSVPSCVNMNMINSAIGTRTGTFQEYTINKTWKTATRFEPLKGYKYVGTETFEMPIYTNSSACDFLNQTLKVNNGFSLLGLNSFRKELFNDWLVTLTRKSKVEAFVPWILDKDGKAVVVYDLNSGFPGYIEPFEAYWIWYSGTTEVLFKGIVELTPQ